MKTSGYIINFRKFIYQCVNGVKRVDRPARYPVPMEDRIFHSIVGIADETGELMKFVKDKFYYDDKINLLHLIEEYGDLFWYYIEGIIGLSEITKIPVPEMFQIVFFLNQAKLRSRYQEKYTDREATHRNIDDEKTSMVEKLSALLGPYSKKIIGVKL